jgi:hypothetical protein
LREPGELLDLLLTPGVGARTVRALTTVAELVHAGPSGSGGANGTATGRSRFWAGVQNRPPNEETNPSRKA